MIKPILFLLVSMTISATATMAQEDCTCSDEQITTSVREADRIFFGLVQSAALSKESREQINFTVTVQQTLRGSIEGEVALATPSPAKCGVAIRAGFSMLIVLRPGQLLVERCSGGGLQASGRLPRLRTAIEFIERLGADTTDAAAFIMTQFPATADRSEIEKFFALVEKIDSGGYYITHFDDHFEYRGIVVSYKEGKIDTIEALE